jgi:endonuclease/exonuclease/phosphatase family metal-dependent hydrolase
MKKLNLISKVVFLLNTLAAAILLLSYVLPFVPPKSFGVLSVLSLAVPFLILVNIIFFVYWFVKLKKQLLLSFLVLLIGYFSYGSMYKFSASKVADSAYNLSIMNYNVRLFNLYNWIPEKNIEAKIEAFIKTQSPDVLSLQEYHPHENIDLSNFKYKFEKLSGSKTKYGQAIFSQYPIVNSGSVGFPNTSNNAIFVDIVKVEDTIRIYNVHLQSMRIDANVENLKNEDSERLLKRMSSTFKMQQSQTELFLQHKNQCKYKVIISGDFNNTEFSYAYEKIKGDLNDAFKEAGNGFGSTYNFKFFPIRIDFILTDKSFNTKTFVTSKEEFSDHYPIMANISLH